MTKLEKADAIARALSQVPVPIVQQAAQIADILFGVIETIHGVNLTDEKTLVAEFAAAREPWQHIHDVATGTEDISGQVHGGSTGE